MSGGVFDYKQYQVRAIADELLQIIMNNGKKTDRKHEWEDEYYSNYSEATIAEMKKGYSLLRMAEAYAHRIDYLVAGDDGEESFHKRLAEDLESLTKAKK